MVKVAQQMEKQSVDNEYEISKLKQKCQEQEIKLQNLDSFISKKEEIEKEREDLKNEIKNLNIKIQVIA